MPNYIKFGRAPFNKSLPIVTGTAKVGQTLTATYGTWGGFPAPSLAGVWTRDNVAISGATALTYVLVTADLGKAIRYSVSATGSGVTVTTPSLPTALVSQETSGVGPTNTGLPTIIGSQEVGQFINVNYGSWTWAVTDQFPHPVWAYQWYRDGVAVTGETDPLYELTSADLGTVITVSESATDSEGTTVVTSLGTAAIIADSRTLVTMTSIGVKTTQTTGSMQAASNILTVASTTGLAVNDKIIVEIGGEAGAGLRNTVGVGGTWPTNSYATKAIMDADTSDKPQAVTYYVYTQDDGFVYYWTGNTQRTWVAMGAYYWKFKLPLALTATITAINGNDLTLNKTAVVATTGANVYFDNEAILTNAFNSFSSTDVGDNKICEFPSGTIACSNYINFNKMTNLLLKGQGKNLTTFKSPRGTPSMNFYFSGLSTRISCRDFRFTGNAGDEGSPPSYRPSNNVDFTPGGLLWEKSEFSHCQDVIVDTVWQYAVANRFGQHCWWRRVDVNATGFFRYFQWFILSSNAYQGGAIDCSITSATMTKGLETFQGDGWRALRCVLNNASFSANSAGGYELIDPQITVTPNAFHGGVGFVVGGDPLININSNISTAQGGSSNALISKGGVIRGAKMIQQGYFDAGQNIITGIIVGPGNVNIKIIDCTYDAPDYVAPAGSVQVLSVGLKSDITDTSTLVLRFIMKNYTIPNPWSQVYGINFTNAAAGKVVDSVADKIRAAIQSGNKTRAQFIADGGDLARTSPPA